MKRMSWYVSIILCLALLLCVGATGVFAAEGNQSNLVSDWGMTLNDEIVVNFKMAVADEDVTVTVGGRNVSATLSDGILRVPVYATELDAEISITVGEETETFTALTYCQAVLGNSLYSNYHQLVKDLLNYGAAAQVYFNESTNISVEGAGNVDVPSTGSDIAVLDRSDALKCIGATLVYRDKIALRYYFEGDLTGCTASVIGASAATVNVAGGYVEVADIMPQDLDESVTVTVKDTADKSIDVTYSPMTYMVRMSQKGSDATKALVKALYNYHLAAEAFVPVEHCQVSFDLGYEGEAIEDMTIVAGGTYGTLPTATRAGYIFEGWTLSDGTAVTAETAVTSTHTLYAKWSIDKTGVNYAVVYHPGANNSYYVTISETVLDGEFAYKTVVNSRGDGTNDVDRRVHLRVTAGEKQVVSMKIFFESCTNTPSIVLWRGDGMANNVAYATDYIVTDDAGNVYDPHNLETGKWYNVTFLAVGISEYMLRPFEGSATNGTYYVKDVTVANATGAFTSQYYVWSAPYAAGEDTHYFIRARYVTDGTVIGNREIIFNTSAAAGDLISMKVQMTQTSGTPDMYINNAGGTTMDISIIDENGNAVSATQMQLGKWYTISWIADGSATYKFYTFQGTMANGSYLVKDIAVTTPTFNYSFANEYYVKSTNALIEGVAAKKITVAHNGDNTMLNNRKIGIELANTAGQVVTMKVKFTEASGTPALEIHRKNLDQVALVVTDAEGNLADSNNLELNKWYTVTWLAAGDASYYIYAIGGQKTTGVYYVKDVTVETVENPFLAPNGSDGLTSAFGYYAQVLPFENKGETIYMGYARPTSDGTNAVNRRVVLTIDNDARQAASMQIYFASCSATPSFEILRDDGYSVDYIITDAEGNVVDGSNLELKKWYTVTWITVGAGIKYRICPITGSAASGSYYMKDITVTTPVDPITPSYYVTAASFAAGEDTHYWIRARETGDGTELGSRSITIKPNAKAGQVVSMDVKVTQTTGTVNFTASAPLSIVDANGDAVAATEMQLNQWYTVSWTADGSDSYTFYSFNGTKATGTYFIKNITVTTPSDYSVDFNLNYEGATGAPETMKFVVGSTYGELPTATRAGYIFEGWTLSDGTAVTAETAVTSTHTLYAKWSIDKTGVNYSVVYGSDGSYYTTLTETVMDGDFAYKLVINSRGDGTNNIVRRVHLNVADGTRQAVSMKVYFAECTNTPSIVVWRGDGMASDTAYAVDYIVTDDEGNVYDPHNLELKKWYNVTFIGAGVGNYMLWFFEGSATNGTVYMKDVTPITNTDPIAATYYVTVAPYVAGEDTHYWIRARVTNDGTEISLRYVTLQSSAQAGQLISMKVQMTQTSGTPDMYIKNAGGTTMSIYIIDENGNAVSATQMQLGKWYTISWIADGSASYNIYSFQGTKATGSYFVKDITVAAAPANPFRVPTAGELNGNSPTGPNGYYGKAALTMLDDGIGYQMVVHATSDGTSEWHRRAYLYVANNSGDVISLKINTTSIAKGTPNFKICTGGGGNIDYTITDAEGNVISGSSMALNTWYTISWVCDGSQSYQIQPFDGSATNGTYLVKNITVTPAA